MNFFAKKYIISSFYGRGTARPQILLKATMRSEPQAICFDQWLKVTGLKLRVKDGWQEVEATFRFKEKD